MANCSIPNSNLANDRISTRSLTRSKKRNNRRAASILVISPYGYVQKRHQGVALQSGLLRWTFDVGRWVLCASRRVKGAWWPSRSSKPSSSRKWRGRFDSYPLRPSFCSSCSRFAVRNVRVAHRATATTAVFRKGGEPQCPVSKSAN